MGKDERQEPLSDFEFDKEAEINHTNESEIVPCGSPRESCEISVHTGMNESDLSFRELEPLFNDINLEELRSYSNNNIGLDETLSQHHSITDSIESIEIVSSFGNDSYPGNLTDSLPLVCTP